MDPLVESKLRCMRADDGCWCGAVVAAGKRVGGYRCIAAVGSCTCRPHCLPSFFVPLRYQGEALDGAVTIRLLKAINELKAVPLPLNNRCLGWLRTVA